MKFRKKPIEIEAFRYGIDNRPDWFDNKVTSNEITTHCGIDRGESQDYYCKINTLEGVMKAILGDYIIKGIKGEVYPCKPDIFEATYELLESTETEPKNITTKEGKFKEFKKLMKPVVEFINDNHHPHVTIVISSNGAELHQSLYGYSYEFDTEFGKNE